MKMNILNFMLGMMVAIGLGIIGMFIIQGVNYLNLFLLIMSGAFLGFPIGYFFDQVFNVTTTKDDITNGVNPPTNLQNKDKARC
jgi:ABC-type proline/glycine betaine transport system permease subunit|tara:strand:+ start:479 stop:730 length:252 start_codon:yes stop_codon:yes gene_type:complete